MNTTTEINTASAFKSFTRLLSTHALQALVKEARRVSYGVKVNKDGDNSVWGYEVKDTENNNATVFKATKIRANVWGATFSTVYWQAPKY